MKLHGKLFLVVNLLIATGCLKAAQDDKLLTVLQQQQQPQISDEQIQEMQKMDQFLQVIVTEMVVEFLTTHPKFVASVLPVFIKEAKIVQEKVVNNALKEYNSTMASVLKKMGDDKELYAMMQEIKPLMQQLFVQEVLKWFQITASLGLKFQ